MLSVKSYMMRYDTIRYDRRF